MLVQYNVQRKYVGTKQCTERVCTYNIMFRERIYLQQCKKEYFNTMIMYIQRIYVQFNLQSILQYNVKREDVRTIQSWYKESMYVQYSVQREGVHTINECIERVCVFAQYNMQMEYVRLLQCTERAVM